MDRAELKHELKFPDGNVCHLLQPKPEFEVNEVFITRVVKFLRQEDLYRRQMSTVLLFL